MIRILALSLFSNPPNAPGKSHGVFWKDPKKPFFEGGPKIDGIIFFKCKGQTWPKNLPEIQLKWAHVWLTPFDQINALQFPALNALETLKITCSILTNLLRNGTMEALNRQSLNIFN
ncbi:MAG: hypothetical protein CM15mP130_2840 [Verrucomicrobiota bacterium]|nr:MAG: hypothetical protein CM15mP130_2840 [Verrucomicrobiota bacterium]